MGQTGTIVRIGRLFARFAPINEHKKSQYVFSRTGSFHKLHRQRLEVRV